jgi:hypothetical protein
MPIDDVVKPKNMYDKKRHKIPPDLWEYVYDLHSRGISVATIHDRLIEDHKLDIGHKSIYNLVHDMKVIKRDHLTSVIDGHTDSVIEKYNWLQGELEDVCRDTKHTDNDMFIKVADRLIGMYEFQLTLQKDLSVLKGNKEEVDVDNGREELLKELEGTWEKPEPANMSGELS